mgnify:CR=1 FL=1
MRAAEEIKKMIVSIIKETPSPVEQSGPVVSFKRRKPEDGNMESLTELNQVFDNIRMLDAEGYPKAFMESEHFKFEFDRPVLKHGKIVADVTITKKDKHE